jgi:phage gp45-like
MPEYQITDINRMTGKRVEITASETTITIKTPNVTIVCSESGKVTIDAPGGVEIETSAVNITGDMHLTGNLSTDGDIQADGDIKAGGAFLTWQSGAIQ